MKKIIPFSHSLLKEVIHIGDVVVDATCGNGNDTLMLANACGNTGHVFAFDVQKQALEKTRELLDTEGINHVTLVQDSHAHLDKYIPVNKQGKIAAAVFNLGYLPKSDKTIITTPTSTITAIKKLLSLLRKGGRVILVIYYGHEGGKIEKDEVIAFVTELSQEYYEVISYCFLNQRNYPPIVVGIEKR